MLVLALLVFWSNIVLHRVDGSPQSIVARFQFTPADEMVLMRTMRDGKPAYFIFDTGCTQSVVDLKTFGSLAAANVEIDAETTNGNRKLELYNPPKLNIGPFSLADAGPVARLDLSSFSHLLDRPIIGLLGNNLWRKLVVQIDFDDGELRFFNPDDQPHPDWGNVIPLEAAQSPRGPDNKYALARLTIGGFEDLFIIDTGINRGGDVPTDGFDRILTASPRPIALTKSITGNGIAEGRVMRAPEFILGDQHYKDMIFGETSGWEGRLGLDFLSRHLVTIDFPHSRMYLKPGKEFNRRDEWDMSGMNAWRLMKRTIALIDPKSPAESAGLSSGDVLLQINGKNADSYELFDLHRLLRSKEGTEINVRFLRDGVTHSASFKLRKDL